MKKIILVILAITLLVVPLSACNDGASQPATTTTDPTPTPTPTPAPPASNVDWNNFVIDVSQIPQEVLDTNLYVAVSIRGLDNPYIVTKIEGMNMFSQWLTSIGQAHTIQVLDSGGSNDAEINNMRQFAALAGGNAIAYADPNESAIAPALAEAIAESGGYIGTAWNKPDGIGPMDFTPNWVIHTSADNFTGGYNTARLIFEAMGGEGNVFVIEGMLGNTAAIDRRLGFNAALAEFPGITVAHEDTGNWLTSEALTLTETWLSVTPDVGGIWNANDNMATGSLQALSNAGLLGQVYVTGIDATDDMVAAVAAGNALATVSANGYLQSSYTLAIAYAAWSGMLDVYELPIEFREFFTPSVLVTADNVQQFMADTPTFDFSRPFGLSWDSPMN